MATASRRIRKAGDLKLSASELDGVLAALRKDYGAQAIVMGREILQPYRIPLGIFTLDYATLGGIPHNRFTQFDGPKHSGKTTASLRAIMGAQQSMESQQAVLVDVEGTYDSTWAGKIGVDNEKLLIVRPDTGEQAVDTTVALVHAREVSLIVIDSLAALLPHKENESSAEDSLVGQQSRLITSMLRKVNGALIRERKRDHLVTILLINQQRAKIGGFAPAGIEPLSNPGGKAVGYFTTLEVRFKNKENLKQQNGEKVLYDNEHAFSISKNKLNAGTRQGDFRMMRQDDDELGLAEAEINDAETMLLFASRIGWAESSGRGGYTLAFGDFDMKFDNKAEALLYLYQNREIYWSLRCHLIAQHAQSMKMPDYLIENLMAGATV